MQMIEAVPNICEAQDKENLTRILGDVKAVLGNVQLLHVDSNADANRTVLTLAGQPEQVVHVCFMLYQACARYIDMRFHSGAHPRLGAVDVCPLIPLKNITLEETVSFADSLARQVAQELQIPVYLYEANASAPSRKNLAFIRKGEYEMLPTKLELLPPDYGPRRFTQNVARSGASVIGTRNFLIAFNISLNTQNVNIAKAIAAKLREKNDGLPGVKAIGWYMEGYGCAQVSFNLVDFHKSNLQNVFEACKKEAATQGLEITGSELIGLVPQEALLLAGKFYAPSTTKESALISTAVKNLLLDKIHPFVAGERILEKALKSN
ncbi:MAG: glutamate formimidoyltransferase [Elusimicrobiaceae bacterium]|nr:glutamate formimidoyltransferase [Elusimicrobiaceae bacterium]